MPNSTENSEEPFFRTQLIERHGKGTRLTASGKELARISRFFMLGLSNFRRGCLEEEQTFRIGASATFIRHLLLPALSSPALGKGGTRYATEPATDAEIERRLHDLTLDFGVVGTTELSRPLQTKPLGNWKLELWMPKVFRYTETRAVQAFDKGELPLVLARELEGLGVLAGKNSEAVLVCDSFLESRAALEAHAVAALLPCFLAPARSARSFVRIRVPRIDSSTFCFHLAWNPRLLRLNPHATGKRDWLVTVLAGEVE